MQAGSLLVVWAAEKMLTSSNASVSPAETNYYHAWKSRSTPTQAVKTRFFSLLIKQVSLHKRNNSDHLSFSETRIYDIFNAKKCSFHQEYVCTFILLKNKFSNIWKPRNRST